LYNKHISVDNHRIITVNPLVWEAALHFSDSVAAETPGGKTGTLFPV
jgi:hypothetical protein